MARGAKQKGEGGGGGGCPDYMMTYGDMMTLLLCFFVMIVSLSQIKEEEQFRAVLDSLRKAFGYTKAPQPVDGEFSDFNAMSIVERIQDEIVQRNKRHRSREETDSKKSQIGDATTVRNIRDGLKITIGGLSLFDEGSAELLPEAQKEIQQVAKIIKGYRNKILVRGHTSRQALPEDSPFADHMGLSFARARAVNELLAELGVSEDRMNLEACGGHEPIQAFAYDEEALANNRRVEVVVKDSMVEEYEGDGGEAD